MPSIMRNNIRYGSSFGGGSGNGEIVELTQAEYDALGEVVNTNGVLYAITDGEDLTAANIAYEGSETGLGNTVEEAINGLNYNLVEQDNKFEWKLAGELPSGTGTLNLPIKFNELDIAMILSGSTARYKWHILYDELFDEGFGFMNGYYYASNNNVCASVNVSKTEIHAGHCSVNGVVTNPTYIGVRYR